MGLRDLIEWAWCVVAVVSLSIGLSIAAMHLLTWLLGG